MPGLLTPAQRESRMGELVEPTSEPEWPTQAKAAQAVLLNKRQSTATAHTTAKLPSAAGGRRARKQPPPLWEGAEYPLYPAGTYDVRCNKIQGPQWLKNHRRWSLRLECSFLTEEGEVSGFLNLGQDPERYRVGRQSNYFKLWCKVNRGLPRRGQSMSWNDFLGKFFSVRIETAAKNSKGEALSEAEQYSKIVEFLECIGP